MNCCWGQEKERMTFFWIRLVLRELEVKMDCGVLISAVH
jgi:hypothetical protein